MHAFLKIILIMELLHLYAHFFRIDPMRFLILIQLSLHIYLSNQCHNHSLQIFLKYVLNFHLFYQKNLKYCICNHILNYQNQAFLRKSFLLGHRLFALNAL